MNSVVNPPLTPRSGGKLRVLTIERISTEHQDERSLDDQRAKSRKFVEDNFEGEIEWRSIASRGSGEVIDRDSYREMEDLIDAGWPDLIVVEDLGRICRRLDALRICESCEDQQTRLIALNDHVDTFDSNWKMSAMFSTLHHERHNQDTSDRIKRTFRNRFSEGAILTTLPYGYVRPAGAKTDDQVRKAPEAELVYETWFQMLEDGASYSEVADWLNDSGVPTGPACRVNRWSPGMVTRVTHNPILKGQRRWNQRTTKRNNRTGKRRSIKADRSMNLKRECPHLAFIEPARYDRLLRRLDDQNANYRRGKQLAKDQRLGVPRSRTVWPGQSMYCAVCGRVMYYGAHGNSSHLVCSGAIDYRCWNGVSVSGHDASKRICSSVADVLSELSEFDTIALEEVQKAVDEANRKSNSRLEEAHREKVEAERQIQNLLSFIKEGSGSSLLSRELDQLEVGLRAIEDKILKYNSQLNTKIEMPSAADVRRKGLELFRTLPADSPEFTRYMNRFIKDLIVYPVVPIDNGKASLRAEFVINLQELLEQDRQHAILNTEELKIPMRIDLFDPPQRIRVMSEVAKHMERCRRDPEYQTEREIATELGVTQPVVRRAKALRKKMDLLGATDPYRRLMEPPVGGKLRRHLHPRYRFEPLHDAKSRRSS